MENVATVNGKEISRNIFQIKLQEFIKNNYSDDEKYSDSDIYEIKSFVIDKLIEDLLIVQYAEENRIYAELQEVKKQFNEITGVFPSQIDFENSLKARGLTVEQIFEDIKNEIVINKVYEKELTGCLEQIDEKTLKDFYYANKQNFIKGPAVKARHIFIQVNDFDKTEDVKKSKDKIESLFNNLKNGQDFAEIAQNHSDCASSKYGGDLGYFTFDEIDEEFARVVFNMKPGTISKPFVTDAGFHISLVDDYVEDYVLPFDKVKSKLEDFVKEMLEQDAIEKFISELWEKADIIINEY